MKTIKKLQLAAAVAAGLTLAGCGSDSSSSSSTASQSGLANHATASVVALAAIADESCFSADTCSASGYEFPEGAIFVAADAADGADITTELLTAATDVATDAVIVLPKGSFVVNSTINFEGTDGLVLTGHGIDATKIDFSSLTSGDGFFFGGGNDTTMRDFAIHEVPKNALKVDGANGVRYNYIATIWAATLAEGNAERLNGIYGIYPVSSQNVLVENSYAKGSRDAGVYVGQSNNIVVRNNIIENNVAGIEIENSNNADVYNNEAFDNSAGLLSFDLVITNGQAVGSNTRMFSNTSYDNNAPNIGTGVVGDVPVGLGMLILNSSNTETYNNTFSDNDTSGIVLTGQFLLDPEFDDENYGGVIAQGWTPLVKNNQIHHNTFVNNGTDPTTEGAFAPIMLGYQLGVNASGLPQTVPAIIYSGLGELMSNWTVAADTSYLQSLGLPWGAYTEVEKNCAYSNIDGNTVEGLDLNIGAVFSVDPADIANPAAGPAETLEVNLMSDETAVLSCANIPTRLAAATVTFDGVVYGCEGDDSELAACAL